MNNAQVHGCPLEGWACFHCGEVFTTVGGAADHFGATPDRTPACQIKLGDERGLVMELRKVEAERDDHEQARTALEEALGQMMAERDELARDLEAERHHRHAVQNSEHALAEAQRLERIASEAP